MRLNMTFRQRRQHLAWQRYQAARQALFVLCGASYVRREEQRWTTTFF